MGNPVKINRIDLLVHPFYYRRKVKTQFYGEKESQFLFNLWKKHVDEVANHKDRLLMVTPQSLDFYSTAGKRHFDGLVEYAREKLGKRFVVFREPSDSRYPFRQGPGKIFETFEDFCKHNEFRVNSETLKTRAMGEYTNWCVVDYLTSLNVHVGLKEVIPYRNRQSTILARKSVSGSEKEYPRPWELKDLNKTAEGKAKLKELMEKYIRRRRGSANLMVAKYLKERNYFKPRETVSEMRKRRRPKG